AAPRTVLATRTAAPRPAPTRRPTPPGTPSAPSAGTASSSARPTLFVVGSHVVADPDLVRRALREGHEVGVHTWTHTDLSRAPRWRRSLELSLSQLGLAGAA
ncbi:MAG: hypothetical protein JWO60_2857, partial [Frankiales bacterium]|nr:hypothetical protein [Frankiales bacterium]